jgi:hypothetical protein
MKNLPKVAKTFGRLGKTERLRQRTMAAIKGALIAAGLLLTATNASATQSEGEVVSVRAVATASGVIVLTPAPASGVTAQGVQATHYSHSSHVSHASHASHCSGYSYCG